MGLNRLLTNCVIRCCWNERINVFKFLHSNKTSDRFVYFNRPKHFVAYLPSSKQFARHKFSTRRALLRAISILAVAYFSIRNPFGRFVSFVNWFGPCFASIEPSLRGDALSSRKEKNSNDMDDRLSKVKGAKQAKIPCKIYASGKSEWHSILLDDNNNNSS